MKIDKRDPRHWAALLMFLVRASAGLVLRACRPGQAGSDVLLYGHRLNGNLLALYCRLRADARPGRRVAFLSLDDHYATELRQAGFDVVTATGSGCTRALAAATALVSDHGLHAMQPLQRLYRRAGLRFFDVWHGIPFKGFDSEDFRLQRRYDEAWVASPLMEEMYVHRFGFSPQRVHVTGYARTDRLVAADAEPAGRIRARLGLPGHGPVILFAPTWAQDDHGRSIYPFGRGHADFLGALSRLADAHGATVVVRLHLNTGPGGQPHFPGVVMLPSSSHPDTEEILLVSDMLVCDWSSIAFDFLLLDRPAFFLDVAPPFRKGFSLGPEYRFGAVVDSLESLCEALSACLLDSGGYWAAHREGHARIRREVYGEFADGHASERCARRLSAADLLDDRSS